jgi:2-methylcitrate dehydratase PrpD
MTGVSRALAETLTSTTFDDFPQTAIVDATRAILDWLGSAMAGALESPARMGQQVVAGLGSSAEATVFAGGRSSAAGAALANGIASHILELDDIHKGSTVHAAAPVIPAALAVAEREHVTGRDFLRAVILGYDAALRVGEAVNPSHYKFWHPTGTAATFGAAAAAGSLMGLKAPAMLDALGSAGTQAAGLWEFNADGTMSKHLHPGKAAFNGVLAADLAKVGFTGARTILEGKRGFFEAMSENHDETRVTRGLGREWKISEDCYKVWACCGHTHSAIDVAGELRRGQRWTNDEAVSRVASIHIETYGPGYEIVKQPNPGSTYEAKFSIAYCVVAALLSGGAPLDAFSADHFGNGGTCAPDFAALLERTTVVVADDLTAKYPFAWPTRVRITLTDGTTLTGAADFPVGNPENPVSTPQLEEKFMGLVAPRWGHDAATRAVKLVHRLPTIRDMNTPFREIGDGPHLHARVTQGY